MNERRRWMAGAGGVFLVLLGIYLLTAPGRIDIVDGQLRYEVAKNWLDWGEPIVTDRRLLPADGNLVNRKTGTTYSTYNAAPSVTPMPLMLIARLLPGQRVERDRFVFSLTGPFFGALLGALLVWGYGLLGIGLRASVLYTALFCLATLWWPASVTVFDQNQHAIFLFGAVLLAWLAGRRQSTRLAALAGLLAGLLINYQEMYALLLPVIGLGVFASPREGSEPAVLPQVWDWAAVRRYCTFGICCCAGLGLFFAYNELRFGTPLVLGRYAGYTGSRLPTWGNPLAGFLGLAISPGKGIFWFSPPLVLALLGARRLWTRAPVLTLTVVGVSTIHFLVIIHLAFFGGDWCWGPRYAIPVMPLWALAFPFVPVNRCGHRRLAASLALVGLLVQVMGISLEAQRFFWEHNLAGGVLAQDPWLYFKDSQLLDRPFEILDTLEHGMPREARRFAPVEPTYALLSPRNHRQASLFVRYFRVFYLPRPWWGWMGRVEPDERPCDLTWLMALCGSALALGGALLARSLRPNRIESTRSDALFQFDQPLNSYCSAASGTKVECAAGGFHEGHGE